MNISAKITGIEYQSKLISELKVFDIKDFNINNLPASSIVKDGSFSFGISKWVSPKRTRSYPYERIYNTLGNSKKITVIPIIKDEGKRGDRDFIQWDTVSLMSLLDVFVIFAYYESAEKHTTKENKITSQLFDNDLVISKITEIKSYHSSALHWNLKEIEYSFPKLIQKVKSSYKQIGIRLNVEFHNEQGIDRFANQFINGVKDFMSASRQKAKDAQNREMQTIQPKEVLSTHTKATITIENYLGGKYYFTTDEIKIEGRNIFLIECKHSINSLLPSIGDIKDGLLKMILYTNLKKVKIDYVEYNPIPVIKLTSNKLQGSILSSENTDKISSFISKQAFSKKQKSIIENLFLEAKKNNLLINIEKAE
ncbi:hypothetical protein [Lutibacter sp. B1]|uniref:hypothetical protein n=1 Tax=Lutibacter sp. B1 TaxID=2725996 RepID=UPI0014569B14|nr:hypothetical protein [Lutibacter sp. B1]NLP58491.1 hypothetical protein [Lutibacter sp. B1]